MGLFKKKNKNPPASRYEFFKYPCRNFDAVIFVHGFRGHFRKTWNLFPALVDSDPNLPSLDILLLGYETGYRPGLPSISRIGRGLLSGIRLLVPNAERVVVVCHSMGGVAALSGIRDAMIAGQAEEKPVPQIDRFVLFGTPLKGTHLATFARWFGFGVLYYTRLMNAQLRELANGDFGHDFERDVTNLIYRPRVSSAHSRPIPIHVCLGEKDWVVNRREAQSVIIDPPFDSLEEGHFGIKNPPSAEDKRYRALAHKLQITASAWFHSLVPQAAQRHTPQGQRAEQAIWTRAEFAMDYRLRTLVRGFDGLSDAEKDVFRQDLLIFAVQHANSQPILSFERALDAGASDLSFRMRTRQ